MTDRELLELAAKAAGYTSHGFAEMACGSPCLFLREADFTGMWDPLTDDGDALRLAVTLGIGTRHHEGWSEVFNPMVGLYEFKHGDCVLAATRRAIVRAAAEIGKAMK